MAEVQNDKLSSSSNYDGIAPDVEAAVDEDKDSVSGTSSSYVEPDTGGAVGKKKDYPSSSSSSSLDTETGYCFVDNLVMRLLHLKHIGPTIEIALLLVFLTVTLVIIAYSNLFPALAKPFTDISGAEDITAFINTIIGIIAWVICFGFWIVLGRSEIEPPKALGWRIYSNQNNAFFSLLNILYGFLRLAIFIGLLAVDQLWATTVAFSLELDCAILVGIIWGIICLRKLVHKCKADLAKFSSTK